MIYLSVFIFLSSLFFFIKSIREKSTGDRDIALILFIVSLATIGMSYVALTIMNT